MPAVITSTSPQRPTDVVVTTASSPPAAVVAAADRARSAQREWINQPPAARAAALGSAADALSGAASELTNLIIREVGKPLGEARGEVDRSISILRYYAQQVFDPIGAVHNGPPNTLLFTTRRPRGVAALITPWNFPLAIPLWKAAPALAYGNAVLLKPAEPATACALRLAELLHSVLPADLFHVLPGNADTGQAVLAAGDVVSFTGSTSIGSQVVVAAARHGLPVQAEMGGQNPSIVLADADLELAAAAIASAVAGYAGQKCTATKRVIVVGDPAPFHDALVEAIKNLAVGDPAQSGIVVGPVIGESARAHVLDAAASAVSSGARILAGGHSVDGDGWYVEPTLVEGTPAGHELECDEVFGPICSLTTAASLDEAIAQANSVRQGLVGAVFSRDLGAAVAVSHRLAAGMIKINAPTSGVDFYLPFGGVKDSSYGGREQGKSAIDTYTSVHTVTVSA
jgi:alpha-ketoglutaric semialdehyde dehydrogenase